MERMLSDGITGSETQYLIDLAAIREDLTYPASLPSLHALSPAWMRRPWMRRQRPASFTASVAVPAPEVINIGSCTELS